MNAHAVPGKCRLMGVNEGHAVSHRIATRLVAVTSRERFELRQKLLVDIVRHRAHALAVRGKGRIDIETVGAAWTRLVLRLHGWIWIGYKNDASEIAAHEGFERSAQTRKFSGQFFVEAFLRVLRADDCAAPFEQDSLGSGIDDHVGEKSGKVHIVSANR